MILMARLRSQNEKKESDLQLDVFGGVEQLKQVVVLGLHQVVVGQSRHWNLILGKSLLAGLFHQFVMLGQHVIDVDFLF